MDKIIRELYYMIDDWAGQQYKDDETAKKLIERKSALEEEIKDRIGEGGQEMLEKLADLNLELENIHDKALFHAALSLGTEITEPRRGTWTAERAGA